MIKTITIQIDIMTFCWYSMNQSIITGHNAKDVSTVSKKKLSREELLMGLLNLQGHITTDDAVRLTGVSQATVQEQAPWVRRVVTMISPSAGRCGLQRPEHPHPPPGRTPPEGHGPTRGCDAADGGSCPLVGRVLTGVGADARGVRRGAREPS